MTDLFKDVSEFRRKFNLPVYRYAFNDELVKWAKSHIKEESEEFDRAITEKDLVEVFDALIDLIYVALGIAYSMGLPFEKGWNRVHEANMKKVRGIGKRNSTIDVIKPGNWEAPNLKELLNIVVGI